LHTAEVKLLSKASRAERSNKPSYVVSNLSSSKGVAYHLFFGKTGKIRYEGMIKRRKIFHTNCSFHAFG